MKLRLFLLVAPLVFAGPVVADNPTGFADVNYAFEVITQYDCSKGDCKWVSHIAPIEANVVVWGASTQETALPLKFALMEEDGTTVQEFSGGMIWSTGCPALLDYCQDVLGSMQTCAANSCTIFRDCPFGMGIRTSSGSCLTSNTQQYCPGAQSHVCGCYGPIPYCPNGSEVANPWLGGWTVPDGQEGGFVQLAICGAYTPVEPDGECEDQEEPCYACDPNPGNNGGVF